MACDARMMDADARAATVQTIAGHMEDALEIQREVIHPELFIWVTGNCRE